MSNNTYRVFVSTDLGGDPDDTQSLIHLLHYTDILKVEGIISTTGPGSTPNADGIRYWVRRTDLDHLRAQGHTDLMSEADVLAGVKQGLTEARAPYRGGSSEGSDWLIECAHRASNEVLWVLVWGSMTDVAQALYDEPSIALKIRINSIGSSNTVHDPASRDFVFDRMADRWPGLWWIEDGVLPKLSHDTFRGYYLGGDQSGEWGNVAFIEEVIRGKGTTHGSESDQVLGDEFPVANSPAGILKEGDTPTFLYLLSPEMGDVGNVHDPTQPNWGGQFHRPYPDIYPNYYRDLPKTATECQATINRWRQDYLRHWKARWGWY